MDEAPHFMADLLLSWSDYGIVYPVAIAAGAWA